ncbi:hypothetical protein [Entomospira culicis]|uniref:Uncharacterized protein n=1 Tax=Entomospira culicis TaxID=2719989 RepID=A0A968GGH9_9SPIO|nr:hypothetical protein [Entomospira culicis]NIZ19452.1 hypothetical protein [Entomospira culicis]NIZ69643.1 hypothetical protein [Entomospira culicis]WDI36754.1 hypothetical protein PVA46_05370 [Entomospira culicis]WDI38383.1 hypothetical protein PVA47_05380 [Entomospira culicis]
MRRILIIVLGVLSFLGCQKREAEDRRYTILVGSEMEGIPFSLPKDKSLQYYDWQVVVDGEGTLEERLERHEVDFYFVDFFTYYNMFEGESEFAKHQVILSSAIDAGLVVRKSLDVNSMATWRVGMTVGTLSDYALDYWLENGGFSRIQVRDQAQGANLMQSGELDAMVLSSYYAQPLLASGEFMWLYQTIEEPLPLNMLLSTDSRSHTELTHIIHDYRVSLSAYQQEPALLNKWQLSDRAREQMLHNDEITPFLSPALFESLRYWRVVNVPFSPSWRYDLLMWLPREEMEGV